jgi:hypothetical protein
LPEVIPFHNAIYYYMDNNLIKVNHLLSEMGILSSFSVAKKISEREFDNIFNKIDKRNKTRKEIDKLVVDAILKNNNKNKINVNEIPGVITNDENHSFSGGASGQLNLVDKQLNKEKNKLIAYTCFASIISKKIVEKRLDKYHMYFIINAIVNMLNLNENDFDEFHKKFQEFKEKDGNVESHNNEEEDNDNDDDEDDED